MSTEINRIVSLLESLIFVAEKPIPKDHCRQYLSKFLDEDLTDEQLDEAFDLLKERHYAPKSGIRLEEIAEGYQFMSSGDNFGLIELYLKDINRKRLSRTALETLSIVAYKQPATKSDIESIRGVSSDYMIQKLLEKELIEINGRSDGPGRPLLYTTTQKFLDHFGLKSIKDLPKMEEFQSDENAVGLEEE